MGWVNRRVISLYLGIGVVIPSLQHQIEESREWIHTFQQIHAVGRQTQGGDQRRH